MINRRAKYIKPITGSEIVEMAKLTREERIRTCNPKSPQGFLRFYTYYFYDTIAYAHAQTHLDVMEAMWLVIQSSPNLPEKYRTTIPLTAQERQIDEILWIGFRELAKTSQMKAFLTYVLAYDLRRYPNVDAYDGANSERILYDIVFALQVNPRLKNDFGDLYNIQRSKDESDQKRITGFVTNMREDDDGTQGGRIRVEAHTTGTPVRGRQHNYKRPDMLWLEDFETEDTITSEAKTDKIARHIASFKGGLADTGNWIFYTANYLTEFGNVQSLIDKAEVSSRMLAFIVPVYEGEWLKGEITWKEKYVWTNEEALGTRKVSIQSKKEKMWTPEKGDQSFITEMLCKPIDESIQEFKKSMFRYITWQELQSIPTVLYIIIDSGGSSKETQRKKHGEVDDTGIAFIYVDEQGNWYVKAYGMKMDAKEIMEFIFNSSIAYKNLENIAIEETMFVEAIKPFYDEARRARGQHPNLKFVKAGGRNKENRIRGLIPRMESGMLYFIEGECGQLEEQLLRFPRAKHDDVSDAVAYGNDVVKIPKFDRIMQKQNGFYETETENSPFSSIGL